MLGEEICWIISTTDFQQGERPIANPLLNPQALRVHVPQFANALSATNPNRGNAVGSRSEREDHAYISQ